MIWLRFVCFRDFASAGRFPSIKHSGMDAGAGMAPGILKNGAETRIKALYSVIQCPTHGPPVLALVAAHSSTACDLL